MYQDILTVVEVADILKVTTQSVKNYINREENPLPVIKLSNRLYRISNKELVEWMKTLDDPRRDV